MFSDVQLTGIIIIKTKYDASFQSQDFLFFNYWVKSSKTLNKNGRPDEFTTVDKHILFTLNEGKQKKYGSQ